MLKEYTNLPNDLIEKIAYTNLDIVGSSKTYSKTISSELSGGNEKELPLHEVLQCNQNFYFWMSQQVD